MRLSQKFSDRQAMVRPSRFAGPGAKASRRITQVDVNKAVKDLLAAGVKVTTDTVRAALGSGSLSTISRMLKSWEKEKYERISSGAGGGGRLVGEEGGSYLISQRAFPVPGGELCSIVINGLHMAVEKEDALRIIAAAAAITAGKELPAIRIFDGEFLVSLALTGPVQFTAGPEFIEQLAGDLAAAFA